MLGKRLLVMDVRDSFLEERNRIYLAITIIEDSELAYRLKWDSGAERWMLKSQFAYTYVIIEELPPRQYIISDVIGTDTWYCKEGGNDER